MSIRIDLRVNKSSLVLTGFVALLPITLANAKDPNYPNTAETTFAALTGGRIGQDDTKGFTLALSHQVDYKTEMMINPSVAKAL